MARKILGIEKSHKVNFLLDNYENFYLNFKKLGRNVLNKQTATQNSSAVLFCHGLVGT